MPLAVCKPSMVYHRTKRGHDLNGVSEALLLACGGHLPRGRRRPAQSRAALTQQYACAPLTAFPTLAHP